MMRKLAVSLLVTILGALLVASPIQAKEDESMGLLINLTTIETGKVGHVLHFAEMMGSSERVAEFLFDPSYQVMTW